VKTVSKSILVIGLIIIILFSSSSIALSGDKTGTMKETKDADFDTILSNALEKNYFTDLYKKQSMNFTRVTSIHLLLETMIMMAILMYCLVIPKHGSHVIFEELFASY